MLKHKIAGLLAVLILLISATGCTNIRFTTGTGKNRFAVCGNYSISVQAADILISERKYSYEDLFNNEIWNRSVGDMTMEEYLLSDIKTLAGNVIYLNMMAEDMQINLTGDEEERISEYAKDYAEDSGFDKADVEKLLQMLLIAEKSFYAMTEDVDTEVSTDEARTISVQYMFFAVNDDVTDRMAENKASEALQKIEDGTDFLTLAEEQSDDSIHSMEFYKGIYDKDFETAAYKLETGQVSPVVETEYGYYIIKCINDNIESDTAKRKSEIVLKRREELFADKFRQLAEKKDILFNEKYLKKIDIGSIKAGSGELNKILLALK